MAKHRVDLQGLKKEIPYKFKPQSVKFGKALMVSYIDSRDAQDILDEHVGPENWQDDYRVIDGKVYGGIGINVTGDQEKPNWVWKWDCGVESNTEQEKGQASDSFKRACVKWGIGRFLYRLKIVELKTTKDNRGKERPAKDDGTVLWNNDQITDYIRNYKLKNSSSKKSNSSPRYAPAPENPVYNTPQWSASLITKVKNLEKDGKKGKDCLNEFLPKYNTARDTTYKVIGELNTDALLQDLIDFIEQQEPEGL